MTCRDPARRLRPAVACGDLVSESPNAYCCSLRMNAPAPHLSADRIAPRSVDRDRYLYPSRDGRCRTGGRSGPPRYGPAGSTTPPRSAPKPRSCPPWPRPPPICAASATSATRAKPTSSPWRSRSRKTPHSPRYNNSSQQFNKAHNSVRAIGERGNALLKMTFKALRNVSLCPWRIGRIVAAALVILHFDHARTTRSQPTINTQREWLIYQVHSRGPFVVHRPAFARTPTASAGAGLSRFSVPVARDGHLGPRRKRS